LLQTIDCDSTARISPFIIHSIFSKYFIKLLDIKRIYSLCVLVMRTCEKPLKRLVSKTFFIKLITSANLFLFENFHSSFRLAILYPLEFSIYTNLLLVKYLFNASTFFDFLSIFFKVF
jgi:hypothetical protein